MKTVSKWPYESLCDLAEIVAGATPDTNEADYWDGTYFWATPKDLSDLTGIYISDTARKITEKGLRSCATTTLPVGSVLFSSRAPIGHVAINNVPISTNQGFKSFIPSEKLHAKYLYFWLKANKSYLNSLGNGATFKEISKSVISKVQIPLPPLQDQIRIAHLLEKVEGLIAKRKEDLAQLDLFLKSVFLEMFGDPVRNEKGWEKKTAIDFADCIVPGRDKPKGFSGNIPWITTNDLKNLGTTNCSRSNLGLTLEEITDSKAKIITAHSVILTCVGDLGVVSICGKDAVINQQLHAFIVKPCSNNAFYMFALSFQKEFMYRNASKTTLPYMNKTICNSIPMILPPLDLQNQFASIVEKVEGLKSKYQQSLADLEALYATLSQKAFAGELDLERVKV